MQFALEDLETIKVIGKGSGGIVQLVRHKWNNKFYALKVIGVAWSKFFESVSLYEMKIISYGFCSNCTFGYLYIVFRWL